MDEPVLIATLCLLYLKTGVVCTSVVTSCPARMVSLDWPIDCNTHQSMLCLPECLLVPNFYIRSDNAPNRYQIGLGQIGVEGKRQKTAYGQCGDGWFQRGNSCYHMSHDKERWNDAYTICANNGGYLVEVNDAVEGHFLETQVKLFNFPEGAVWLGANDNMIKGDFVWAHSNTLLSSRPYTHWSPGEPNDLGGNENCLVIYTNGLWNDQDCGSIFHYICEKDAVLGSIVG